MQTTPKHNLRHSTILFFIHGKSTISFFVCRFLVMRTILTFGYFRFFITRGRRVAWNPFNGSDLIPSSRSRQFFRPRRRRYQPRSPPVAAAFGVAAGHDPLLHPAAALHPEACAPNIPLRSVNSAHAPLTLRSGAVY